MRTGRHRPSRYTKHKVTKLRTIEIPEGFKFLTVERHPQEPRRMRIVFKKEK